MTTTVESNRLISQASPYLRQHAHNPVDWYPWGQEALARARDQDRPILLSIGYSACHWCHVMERESFENADIAGLMNEHFVNIKVDREERPDLDEIYMAAVQALIGSGGWPMTVFLTPGLQPFYGGTYFPPEDRYGRPGFPTVLRAVAELYRNRRGNVDEQAGRLMDFLQKNAQVLSSKGASADADDKGIGEGVLAAIADQLEASYDSRHGGFATTGPKFPGSMSLSILLRQYRHSGAARLLEMAEHTLAEMARGGMYDQLGGGFHRYSVDERWLVPHFEKMLYDNALLVWTYLEALQASGGRPLYRQVVEETLGYVRREMTSPEGGYYSTQDADSEGVEGRFFVWSPEQVQEILGTEQAELFCRYFDITEEGNFEDGTSILHVDEPIPDLARFLGVDEEAVERAIVDGKERLRLARESRVHPGRDEKILAAWNGLMISAMARAASVLDVVDYLESGSAAARFVLDRMCVDGTLMHVYNADGELGDIRGYQDDYGCMINGLVDLFEASFDTQWLQAAVDLTDTMVDLFWDADGDGGFFFTEADASDVIVRTKNPFDNATPSGNSMAVLALLRLAALTGQARYRELAERTLQLFDELMRQSPTACCQMAAAVDFYRDAALEIAVVGPVAGRRPLLQVVHGAFLPNKVVAGWQPWVTAGGNSESSRHPEQVIELVPLLQGRLENAPDAAVAFVCRDSVCSVPIDDCADLRARLMASQPGV